MATRFGTDTPARGHRARAHAGLSTSGRYAQLQTEADESLRALVELARTALGCATAALQLLDPARAFFETVVGLAPAEAARHQALCMYGLIQGGVHAVADAAREPSLAEEPVVTATPGVRAFATAPVRNARGERVGVLAGFDPAPREFTPEQLRGFALVAAQLERQLAAAQGLTQMRQRHERQLARLQMLEGMLDAAAGTAILAADPRGVVRWFSEGAERLLGHAAQEVEGRMNVLEFYDTDELARRAEAVRALAPSEAITLAGDFTAGGDLALVVALGARVRTDLREWSWIRRDGARVPVAVAIEPSRDEDGRATGLVAVAHDLSDSRAADRAKADFLAAVNHELRTPLTAIRASVGLVLGGVVGDIGGEAREMLTVAAANCERLGRLVDDVLDAAKLESGTTRFEFRPAVAGELVAHAVAANRPYAEQLGVGLVARADAPHEAARASVMVDEGRIQQVLANLISNAAKYSPRGGSVEVWVEARERRVRFSVRDHGPGIPPAFRSRMFGRFMQASAAGTRGGTGLGLSIARAIVEQHGGLIDYESEPGRGATVFFELPAHTP